MSKKIVLPMLRSLPVVDKLNIGDRAELLPKIESGELAFIDINARVYRNDTKNHNPYVFQNKDLPLFAQTYEGQPFLRNHDTSDIDARDGTIIDSKLEGSQFRQTIRITTRRGMTDFVEGKIDRFSIGWFYDDVLCSICNQSWFSLECRHSPGRTYKVGEGKTEKLCQLIFVNPKGKETSAVNTPAVVGTGIDELQEFKLELFGDVTAVSHARRASLTHLKGDKQMKRKSRKTAPAAVEEPEDEFQIGDETSAALELSGANDIMQRLREQQDEAHAMHLAQCQNLLETSLAASRLPAASQKAIKKDFQALLDAQETFTAAELLEAIKDKRDELAELASIEGPARGNSLGGMFTGVDQFRAALSDLLAVPRDAGLENVKVRPLTGIREAYLLATGDYQFMGGYHPEFANVSANFPGIVADQLNKILIKAWDEFGEAYGWWEAITTIEHFNNLQDPKWIRTGTIASLPSIAERGSYDELPIGDAKESSDWGKYGGYIPLTLEAVINDDVRAFRRMPREAALAGRRNISEQIAAIFTQASGAGPTMSDGGALFNATAQSTVGGHLNLLTTALGTDYVAWGAVATAMFKKKMMIKGTDAYTGKPHAIRPKYVLVPADLADQAFALFIPRWSSDVEVIATKGGPTYGGKVFPLVVPEWTDATDWAAAADPKLSPHVMLGEIFGVIPQIFNASSEMDPAMFANDESRLKVRQFLNVGVADHMGLAKNNVA